MQSSDMEIQKKWFKCYVEKYSDKIFLLIFPLLLFSLVFL